jgi:hypothetical protein
MKLNENKLLKEYIFKRLEEVSWSPSDLIKDAEERGFTITSSSFSNYKKGKKGGLTADQVAYIASRLDIPFGFHIGTPTLVGDKLKYELEKYDELRALGRLKEIFGK